MDVLILSPHGKFIEESIIKTGDNPITRSELLHPDDWPTSAQWVISFGYTKIIPNNLIDKFRGRIINIHISLLPWNRGADPNFWSWFDNTPKGVSIHQVSEKIDAGKLLARHRMEEVTDFRPARTLRSTYYDLIFAAAGLFHRKWPQIKHFETPHIPDPEPGQGSFHAKKEMDKFREILPSGWEIPVEEIVHLGDIYRGE